ncbi:Serine/threonine-protein phosphatase PP1-2 [Hypsibius exemplaris]|uniref:Serine/threonine-protein phosphatase n=1 Tax=Hypsibius exemplaris TaxID=2072580 RepID=A0A1W0WCW6_HYPEX|nr:Serine/threonine-protein phosphatase PP1-2 [Hypsibius exemplaris]
MGVKRLKLITLLDRAIERLVECRNDNYVVRANLQIEEINVICDAATRVFKSQPMLLRIQSPVVVAGDIHGQFNDLLRIFELNGQPEKGQRYLFLGDYVDRGPQSIEVVCLLLAYKIKYPHDFYLIRGNHEERDLNDTYGFKDECEMFYSTKLWRAFNRVFDYMPMAAVVNEQVFCTHGGIGPGLETLSQISAIRRPHRGSSNGVACDLMWADPDPGTKTWKRNAARNVSYMFGKDQVNDFLFTNKLKFMCRAHEQPEEKGFSWPFFPELTVLTIFSAPGYEGTKADGAVVRLSANCGTTIKTLPYITTQENVLPMDENDPDDDERDDVSRTSRESRRDHYHHHHHGHSHHN